MVDVDFADFVPDPSDEPDGLPKNSVDDLAEDLVSYAPVSLEVSDVVLDPVFARRRDALLRSVPVHDIVSRSERADIGLGDFDVRALILAAFDAVIARQGFPDRTTPEQVIGLLTGIAAVQAPKEPDTACRAVAEHVLDGLTNRRERTRRFSLPTVIYHQGAGPEVIAERVPRTFWLLREAEDPYTGAVYLECSTDAVNALVGGLDLPLEDRQLALEIVLERQLARGQLDAAHATAVQARRLTAAYIIQIDELLAETARFLPGTDWRQAAPKLIDAALAHITECLTREGRLLEHVASDMSERPPTDVSAERRTKISAALTKLLSESRHLHTTLMKRLMGARSRFLDAQDDQMFRPVLPSVEYDLLKDLLEPALALSVDDLVAVTDAYLCGALGPHTPVVLHWGDFVEALIHSPEAAPDIAEENDGEILFRPDPLPLVNRELLDAAHAVLATVELPVRLSTLIAASPEESDPSASVVDLFVAASLRAFDNAMRDLGPARGDTWDSSWDPDTVNAAGDASAPPAFVVGPGEPEASPVHLLEILGDDAACIDDGTALTGPGWSGNDLIVCVDRDQLDAVLLDEIPKPAPTPLAASVRPGAWASFGALVSTAATDAAMGSTAR